jgi:hypothetical protein
MPRIEIRDRDSLLLAHRFSGRSPCGRRADEQHLTIVR